MSADLDAWAEACDRVVALVEEHRDVDAVMDALGLPPGLREFSLVLGDDGKGLPVKWVTLLVALGALLAREKTLKEMEG